MPRPTQSIREIVATQPSAAAILQRFDIDLCTRGSESLHSACVALQLSLDQVLEKLADAEVHEHGSGMVNPAGMSLSRLMQHIVRVHHQAVRQELPRLSQIARKLALKHSERAPELSQVADLVEDLRLDMFNHLQKEEQILFPYIAQMDQDSPLACMPPQSCFRSVTHPVFMMAQEHESATNILARIEKLTRGYKVPEWACTNYLALCSGLKRFQADLRQHVYLENELLFPRAIEMESATVRRA